MLQYKQSNERVFSKYRFQINVAGISMFLMLMTVILLVLSRKK